MNTSWIPVTLSVVDHYTIHYTINKGEGNRNQTNMRLSVFCSIVSSGVVGGLVTGEQYQFGVSVTLVAASGQMYTGPVSNYTQLVTVSIGEHVALHVCI